MNRLYRYVRAGLVFLVLVIGCWSVYWQVCAVAAVSYQNLRDLCLIPLVGGALLCGAIAWRRRSSDGLESGALQQPRLQFVREWRRLFVPLAIALVHVVTRSDEMVYLLAAGYLSLELFRGPVHSNAPVQCARGGPWSEAVILAGLCLAAALLTSATVRPDADDAYFLNVAATLSEFRDVPPQSLDTMHRDALPPVEQTLHLPQSYEILVGLLADLTGISVHSIYYIIFPPIWAIMAMLAHWLVLRTVLPGKDALWGTSVFLFLLVTWGDGHHTFGNFGLVRLFQGKAVYLNVILPLVVLAALRYRIHPHWPEWLILALSQLAAVTLTTNAVVVAPLAASLALLAAPGCADRSLKAICTGLAASLPLLILAALLYSRLAPFREAMHVDELQLGYRSGVFGSRRAALVLLALIILPAMARVTSLTSARWIVGYVWLVVVVLFMPWVSVAGGHFLGPVYSWRLYWAVPVPLLISLAVSMATRALAQPKWQAIAAAAGGAVLFVAAGPLAINASNVSLYNIGRFKVAPVQFAVARKIVELAPRRSLALVPEEVAVYIAGFSGTPRLVGIRILYLQKLEHLVSDDELASRISLFQYISGNESSLTSNTALALIQARAVAIVAFRASHRDAQALLPALKSAGFQIHQEDCFLIAIRAQSIALDEEGRERDTHRASSAVE
jgi:hypothetical protein